MPTLLRTPEDLTRLLSLLGLLEELQQVSLQHLLPATRFSFALEAASPEVKAYLSRMLPASLTLTIGGKSLCFSITAESNHITLNTMTELLNS